MRDYRISVSHRLFTLVWPILKNFPNAPGHNVLNTTRRDISPDPAIRNPRVKRFPARISQINQLSHDTVEVILTLDKTADLLHAYAGQFCTIRVPETDVIRAYSLSRAPQAEKSLRNRSL